MNKSKLNIGIIAHVDAGKTTLTENILHLGGVVRQPGRVDKGTTQTDSMEVERRRGISVRAAAVSFEYGGTKFNLIDTPGHVDFMAEVERSLSVLDGVILVISAKEGLQSQTKVLMDTIVAQRIPAVIFVNKIDRLGAEPDKVAKEAGLYMGGKFVMTGRAGEGGVLPLTREEFMELNGEVLYNLDDGLMEKYVNDEGVTCEEFLDRAAFYSKRGALYPIFYGSALQGVGVARLLDELPLYLPASDADADAPLSGVVFKVDNSGERKVYARLYQGTLRIRETIMLRGKEEKITRLAGLESGKIAPANVIRAGDIAILYVKDLKVGDILGEAGEKVRKVRLGRPTLSVEVLPERPEQKRSLYEALALLSDEDPMLNLYSDNKLTVRMFGEVQMEILRELLLVRYGIPVNFSETMTVFMETPMLPASSRALFPGYRFRAGAGFRVEPLPRGSGLEYVSEVSFGDLKKTFQNAVCEAVYETCKRGLYGWEITDAKVIFDYSCFDSVTSAPADFRDLTPLVLMEAFGEAGMGLLEPLLEFELRIPGGVGKALYDLDRMKASVEATETLRDDYVSISGIIPADTCKNYGTEVGSYTEGRGVFMTKFHGYRETAFDSSKVNESEINPAANKGLYLLRKLGAK